MIYYKNYLHILKAGGAIDELSANEHEQILDFDKHIVNYFKDSLVQELYLEEYNIINADIVII